MRVLRTKKFIEKFNSYHMPEPMSGCWIWIGARIPNGYGQIRCGYHKLMAHRVSAFLSGELKNIKDSNMYVCHKCDNPTCCNPQHLFVGDHMANMRDRELKGRNKKGEDHGNAKITIGIVKKIRDEMHLGKNLLSRKYGISPSQAFRIMKRESWAHIE